MNSGTRIAVLLGVAGLFAAWWYSRQQQAQLDQLLARSPQPPVLPSTPIGTGYIGPIRGSHPSMAPPIIDPNTGDISPALGTDLLLPGVDPDDPWFWYGQATTPDIAPLVDQATFDQARIDMAGNVVDNNGGILESTSWGMN